MNLEFIKKYPVFTLILAVTLLLLAGAGTGLFISARLYSRQASALDALTNRLQQLYRRDPFPAEANVRKEAENLKDLIDQFNELNEFLRVGQVDPQAMRAADFMQFMEKSLRKLRSGLQDARIKFPEKYAFGFDKYEGGLLPAPDDIPRLVQQLKIMEILCDILRSAAVTELVAIERDSFEQAPREAEVSAPRRGAPAPEPAPVAAGGNELYSRQRFKMTVKARENAAIKMLNLLARRPLFMVVTRIEMLNPRQDYNVSGPGAAPGAAPSASERQIVLGREELEVKLDLDVYQFAPSLDFKEDGGK